MNILLFAAGAYLLLLPFLKFIPIQLSFKQKVVLSSLSFCVTIVALIGSEYLPFISALAILILLTGLMAYLVQSRLQNRIISLHPEPQPEQPPASQPHEPKIYETTIEYTNHDANEETESEIVPIKDTEEDSFDEGQHDYIEELDWKENEPMFVNGLDHEEAADGEELPVIGDMIPELITDPSAAIKDEEEEEYARLFSGRKR